MKNRQSATEQAWLYGTVRTLLISYGVIAFGWLSARSLPAGEPQVFGMAVSAQGFVIIGLGTQLLLMAVRALVKRVVPDRSISSQALAAVEIIGDGVTVLLFALATLGPIIHLADQL